MAREDAMSLAKAALARLPNVTAVFAAGRNAGRMQYLAGLIWLLEYVDSIGLGTSGVDTEIRVLAKRRASPGTLKRILWERGFFEEEGWESVFMFDGWFAEFAFADGELQLCRGVSNPPEDTTAPRVLRWLSMMVLVAEETGQFDETVEPVSEEEYSRRSNILRFAAETSYRCPKCQHPCPHFYAKCWNCGHPIAEG